MRNIFESIMDSLNVLCILVVLVSAATAYGGYTTYQGPVYVRAGEDFSITCTTDAFRFPKWTLNGHSMEGNFALQVIRPKERGRQEAKLHVLSAGPQHSGAYSCDPFDVDKHYIYVVDTERLNDTQKCFLIQPGRSLALSCEPESRAPFFWFYGKENTRYLPKGHVEMRNAQLLFHGVQLSDAGRYTCRSVRDPSIETVFHLVTPITSKQSSHWNTVGRIGASVALDCDFIADPQPHIEWFIGFDHAELKKRAQHRVHISTNPKTGVANSRLIVQNVDPTDTNEYTCRGSHLMCGIHTEQIISMRAQKSEILTNEEQTKFGLAVLVNPKLQKLILKCNYTGTEDHGDATYAWFKDDQPIQEGTKFHIETTGTASVLTVEDCNVDDAGNYKCKLRGEEATLRVLMYPTLEHVERSKNQVQGDPLTLTCKARGSPTPTIKWLKDGEPLIMDERMEKQDIDSVKDAKLIIRNLQYSDKGKYVCQATSLNVTTEVEINVRVKDKYAALWPFLGICAEVAILCTIIFIYEKRRTKPEFEDDDDKKESSSHRK
ncbi:basigin-like isoform X1 [Varroa destructor]|uniref:Ig-like domain-containing protein n=1 Tax=Varroa destructor TaxID=109461 RepID=A0A7M7KUI6_VARDE|nr:basigin-like isoform X1 [Varroa destructor]